MPPLLPPLLAEEPFSVEFFQAVRLLERLAPERRAVLETAVPDEEVVRFSANPATGFPPSEVHDIEADRSGPPRLVMNVLGLYGPLGTLPLDYSVFVERRVRRRAMRADLGPDDPVRDFLDIFNHRIASLYYRAWEKYQFAIAFERDGRDLLTLHLLALIGVGTPELQGRLDVPDVALASYAGLLAMRPRPAVSLQRILADYFGVPVELQHFCGSHYELTAAPLLRLAGENGENSLDGDAVLSGLVYDPHYRVGVRIGPVARTRYNEFDQDGAAIRELRDLLRFFGDDQFDFDVRLVMAGRAVPPPVLEVEGAVRLGWDTWLWDDRLESCAFPDDSEGATVSLNAASFR